MFVFQTGLGVRNTKTVKPPDPILGNFSLVGSGWTLEIYIFNNSHSNYFQASLEKLFKSNHLIPDDYVSSSMTGLFSYSFFGEFVYVLLMAPEPQSGTTPLSTHTENLRSYFLRLTVIL